MKKLEFASKTLPRGLRGAARGEVHPDGARPAREALVITFKVYRDGDGDDESAVEAATAGGAAESFWLEEIESGRADPRHGERLVVLHPQGPDVDPSATWHQEDGDVFAVFVVSTRVEVQVTATQRVRS